MSDEGMVYRCEWRYEGGKVLIYVTSKPELRVEAERFDTAEQRLCELICEKLGDGEATLDFSESFPSKNNLKAFLQPDLVCISGNDNVQLCVGQSGLYSKGFCSTCGQPNGDRTRVPAEFESLPGRSDGAISGFTGPIFSGDCLNVLSQEEMSKLDLLEVHSRKQGKKKFFEVIGRTAANFVAGRGLPGIGGFVCDVCKHRTIYHLIGRHLYHCVSGEELGSPVFSCFVVGEKAQTTLVVQRNRWLELLGHDHCVNIVSRPLLVAYGSIALKTPVLPVKSSSHHRLLP